ncbi:MAG TPA: hypothetical protein VHR38_00885 [Solirubrobacterales bacterium]|nr:hypothetical protein [Solirubrobacterales bacterium]
MRTPAILLTLVVLGVAGCGGGSGKGNSTTQAAVPTTSGATAGVVTGKLPPGAVEPADPEEQAAEGPAATEANPGVPAVGPKASGELSGEDRSGATAAVADYIRALDRHDASHVCTIFAPGALDLGLLPKRRAGCVPSLRASIGTPPPGGGPAWRRTTLVEVQPEDLGDGRARVSATVTHHFSDRKYVSVEDDVIYLEQAGGRWLLAKPSATLYRAVGYQSPPLAAFTPPAGW